MSGVIKELMLDFSLNRLSVDMRSDLIVAIQTVLASHVFTYQEIEYLNMYLSGYNAIEIAAHYLKHTEEIESTLERIFTAIEHQSGYTDQNFIHKLELSNRYRKGKLRDLSTFLVLHGKSYLAHEIKE